MLGQFSTENNFSKEVMTFNIFSFICYVIFLTQSFVVELSDVPALNYVWRYVSSSVLIQHHLFLVIFYLKCKGGTVF